MAAILKRVEEAKLQILGSDDPNFDRVVKGMVRAYTEILEVKWEDRPDLITIEEKE